MRRFEIDGDSTALASLSEALSSWFEALSSPRGVAALGAAKTQPLDLFISATTSMPPEARGTWE
jgi:hypothetical protein